MCAEVANHLFGVPHVISRLYNPDHERAYMQLGIDYVCGTSLVAEDVFSKIVSGHGSHIDTFGEFEVLRFTLDLSLSLIHISPAAAAPSTELPRHHVHHSYIWLESVRTIFIIAVCVVVANFSTIIGLVAEEGMGAEAGFIMAVAGIGTLVVILLTFGIVAGLRVDVYKRQLSTGEITSVEEG